MIADTDLESGGAPIDELDGTLRLEGRNGRMHDLGNHISPVQQTGSHVLATTRIAFHHLVIGFEARHGDLLNRVGLVRRFGCGDYRSVSNQGKVNARIWDEVGLELGKIDIERSIEPK